MFEVTLRRQISHVLTKLARELSDVAIWQDRGFPNPQYKGRIVGDLRNSSLESGARFVSTAFAVH